ncbi:MAG: hypothetical protein ACYDH5_15630 [Acidimicrobiales bacterium]
MSALLAGYARLSTTDQSLDAQRDALAAAGCGKVPSASSMPSIIFGLSGSEDDIGKIRSDHRQRRRAARASRKLGVVFFGYQGRGVQVVVVPCAGMYQVQMAAYSHSESEAARSGPLYFQHCGSSAPITCFTSRHPGGDPRARQPSAREGGVRSIAAQREVPVSQPGSELADDLLGQVERGGPAFTV